MELALCQRYYEIGSAMANMSTTTATSIYVTNLANFKVTKRANPGVTVQDYAGTVGRYSAFSASIDTVTHNINAVVAFTIDQNQTRIRFLYQPAGATYDNFYCSWKADAEL